MMTYLKHVGNKKHADLKTKSFHEIKDLYKKVKRFDDSFITIGSTKDERKIKEMNQGASDLDKKKKIVKEDVSAKVPAKQDVAEQGTKKRKGGHMKMIARKRKRPQPDVDSDDEHRKCLKIVTFECTIDSEIMETKSFISKLDKVLSPEGDYLVVYRVNGNFRAFNYLMEDQTVLGKDYSNLLIADSLLKTIWFINAPCYGNEALASPKANGVWIAKDVKETLRSDQDLSECLNTSSMKFKESTPKKHEVKQVQQSCLGEDCWELYIPDLVPMPPKRTSTSEAPAMTQAAIKKLVANSVFVTLEAQAANMANTDNTTRPREALVARKCSYKEFMSYQPINFKEEAYKITWVELKKLLIKKYCRRTEVQKMEDEFYHLTVKGNDLKAYVRRFQELATLCPIMVPDSEKMMEVFIGGLPQSIEGNVTASKHQTLEEAISIA
ncbi:reverse transcriptase domain-containing protein [Tanacetum coccineum]